MKSLTMLRALFLSVSLSVGLAGCGENVPSLEPFCGDGSLDDGEQCDDGGSTAGDGCDDLCLIETSPDPICGDGIKESNEACDDGNIQNDDGCNAKCQIEPPRGADCGDGIADPSQFCFDAAVVTTITQDLTNTNNSGELLFLDSEGESEFLLTAPGTADLVRGLGTDFDDLDSIDSFAATQIVSGDFDLDGDLDVAMLIPEVGFQIGINNNGNIKLGASANVDGASALAVGDLNDDGDLDLVATSTKTDSVVFFVGANGTQFTNTSVVISLETSADPVDVKLADMNDDGRLDVITANHGTNDFAVALANEFGFGAPTFKTGFSSITEIAVKDFNNDGRLDIAAVDEFFVSISKQNVDGSFVLTGIANAGGRGLSTSIEAADLDGDGYFDLIVNNSATEVTNDVLVFFNLGDGSIPISPSITLDAGDLTGDIAVTDLNQDGVTDIGVVSGGSNTVSIFRSNP